jgi:hypothetical protein
VARRKPNEYAEARRLRRVHGTPLKRIARRLGVSVSTAHLWTKDIVLTDEQRLRNRRGPGGPQAPDHTAKLARARAETFRERRRAYQQEGWARALERDPLHLAEPRWLDGPQRRSRAAGS